MTPTTPTSDGSSERDRLIALLTQLDDAGIDNYTAADEMADALLEAGFTRAHGETVPRHVVVADLLSSALAERDALAAKLREAQECLTNEIRSNDYDRVNLREYNESQNRATTAVARAEAAEQRAARLAEILALASDACRLVGEGKPVPWQFLQAQISTALAGNAATDVEGWIACSERMPPKGETVLAYWRNTAEMHGVATWGGHDWHDPDDDSDTYVPADWWRPLPAPPAANAATKETPDDR